MGSRQDDASAVQEETTEERAVALPDPPGDDALGEIVRRVVDVAQPDRILLFGSAARGEARPEGHPLGESDVDLMVVKQEPCDRSRLTGDIYRRLHGVGRAVDVIVVTPEQVERYRDAHGLVFALALRDGKEVYRA